ncbi:MAG: putative lysine decarboxylase [Candidatus Tokpelaia sp. JSC085]|nr:MAG: putative lysine decarboxylase [Candidatus Tokpelaia sp. JSC085]
MAPEERKGDTLSPHFFECEADALPAGTLQTRASAYRLAYTDTDFLMRRELRPLRLALEMMKPEYGLREKNIRSTVVLFGSARIPAPPEPGYAVNATNKAAHNKNLTSASCHYEQARQFARLCSQYSAITHYREFVIMTGGGPGIMEAGNRGAADVGAPSIGLNIMLPYEQIPNPYITQELSFSFRYFAIRKMHFLMWAKALAIFPGGFGTFDELFEALTMIQTGRMGRVPVLMFGKAFWKKALDIDFLVEQGTIAPDDVELLSFVDSATEGWKKICSFYNL